MKKICAPGPRALGIGIGILVIGFVLLIASACGSVELDSRCRIDAGQHSAQIERSITKSKLWRTYFEEMSDSGPLVQIKVDVERYKQTTHGGDYDGGTVTFVFEARSLKHNRLLFDEKGKFEIDSILIGQFDKDASREEVQEIAFEDAEAEAFPYLDRWVNLTAIKAMGLEGSNGAVFVPTLEGLLQDEWISGDMKGEARRALKKING
jgi:hypothetical protein